MQRRNEVRKENTAQVMARQRVDNYEAARLQEQRDELIRTFTNKYKHKVDLDIFAMGLAMTKFEKDPLAGERHIMKEWPIREQQYKLDISDYVLCLYASDPGGKTVTVVDFTMAMRQSFMKYQTYLKANKPEEYRKREPLNFNKDTVYRYLPTIYDFILSQQGDPKMFDTETMDKMRLTIEDGYIVGLKLRTNFADRGITGQFKSLKLLERERNLYKGVQKSPEQIAKTNADNQARAARECEIRLSRWESRQLQYKIELAEFVLGLYESVPGAKVLTMTDFETSMNRVFTQYDAYLKDKQPEEYSKRGPLDFNVDTVCRHIPTIYDFILSRQDDPKLFDAETMDNMRLKIEDGFIVGLVEKIDLTEPGITSQFKPVKRL